MSKKWLVTLATVIVGKRLFGRVARILLLLIVLLGVGVYVLVSNLDAIIKMGVQKGGTAVLQVPTVLDGVTVSIKDGKLGFDGLALGSPEGFSADEMLRVAHAHVTMDLRSLRQEEMIIREVVVQGPEVTLELSGGKTNWGALLKTLEKTEEESADESEAQSGEEAAAQRKVRIDRVVIENGKIKVTGLPLVKTATVPLPRVEIKDLRTADGTPLTVAKALSQVISSLYKSIIGAVGDIVPVEQLNKIKGEAVELLGTAGGLFGDAGGKVAEPLSKGAEKAKGLIGGILGGKKDE